MITFVLMDVEGTVTDIRFVKQKLFPYAYERMSGFVARNFAQLSESRENLGAATPQEMAAILKRYIDEDKKEPSLKLVQGKIWKEGYESGELKGHVYPDVAPAWRKWRGQGVELGIYSSGSVQAQKLLFAHSVEGDLTPLLSRHFDLGVGKKREASSYENILGQLDKDGSETLFLSDVEEELDAAQAAGLKTGRLFRDEKGSSKHPAFETLEEIELSRW